MTRKKPVRKVMTMEEIREHGRRLAADAPPLTEEQRTTLRALLAIPPLPRKEVTDDAGRQPGDPGTGPRVR